MNSGIMPNFEQILGLHLVQAARQTVFSSLRRDVGAEAHAPSGRSAGSMMSSRPSNAPPQMKRMLVVSTCRNSCCGCLRPPLGGTLRDRALDDLEQRLLHALAATRRG